MISPVRSGCVNDRPFRPAYETDGCHQLLRRGRSRVGALVDPETSKTPGRSNWVSIVVMALVFSGAIYLVKGRSLGMTLGETALVGLSLIVGACIIDVLVRHYRR